MTQCRAEPRKKFAGAEGLGYIIVSSSVQSCYLICLTIADGQHHDRQAGPLAQPFEHVGAVHVRKTQVQQYNLGARLSGLEQTLFASGGFDHSVTISFKSDAQ